MESSAVESGPPEMYLRWKTSSSFLSGKIRQQSLVISGMNHTRMEMFTTLKSVCIVHTL